MGQNYFNTLPLRLQLEELGKCRFMDRSEFADGVDKLRGKKIVIVGCGAQGLNQGLNLRDSGLDVSYALRAEAIADDQLASTRLARAAAWLVTQPANVRTAIEEREGQHLVGPVAAQTLGAIRLRDFAQQGAREGGIERGLARKGGVGHAQFRLHWRHVSSALQPTGWCPGCQGRAAQRVC